MSRNKIKITKLLEAKGYIILDLDWEPIGGAPIMEGPSGGWHIEFDAEKGMKPAERLPYGYTIMEYNIGEVLKAIEELPVCVPDLGTLENWENIENCIE
jgi:hypothetical protein